MQGKTHLFVKCSFNSPTRTMYSKANIYLRICHTKFGNIKSSISQFSHLPLQRKDLGKAYQHQCNYCLELKHEEKKFPKRCKFSQCLTILLQILILFYRKENSIINKMYEFKMQNFTGVFQDRIPRRYTQILNGPSFISTCISL